MYYLIWLQLLHNSVTTRLHRGYIFGTRFVVLVVTNNIGYRPLFISLLENNIMVLVVTAFST